MAENTGEQPPLEPDLIIAKEDGKTTVSPIQDGQVGNPYTNATVSESGISTGRIIRGKIGPSGRTQEELQKDFKPLISEKQS